MYLKENILSIQRRVGAKFENTLGKYEIDFGVYMYRKSGHNIMRMSNFSNAL